MPGKKNSPKCEWSAVKQLSYFTWWQTICSCRKQSCCGAEMVPSSTYTSLIKVKKFSKSFDCNNIFYCYINQRRHREKHLWLWKRHQEEWYLGFLTNVTKKKVSWLPVVQDLIIVGLPFYLNFAISTVFSGKIKSSTTLQKCSFWFLYFLSLK